LHDARVLEYGRLAVPQNFIECDRDQELLLPPSLHEWLPHDHLAWFVIDAVAEMDLGTFYAAYREDGWGRAAFDPRMMVALLLYAYAVGERSARKIERRCQDDVAFRVICSNRVPDQTTIARFRARHEQALSDTFTKVLALCAQAGLLSVGLVALDGTLIVGNAAKTAGVAEPIGTVLADGGYWNSPQISAIRASGTDVIAPTSDRKRTKPRKYAPPRGREAERIEALLAKAEGKALYRRRQQLVEPVFTDTKFNRRADRFQRRGLSACNSEWRLIAATHNLLKHWRAGLAANRDGMPAAAPA
jgi:transposase